VLAASDRVDAVVRGNFERHCPSLHLGDLRLDPHFHPEQRGREMIDLDARADRILARIEVLEQQLAASHLDVAHHHRRGVDARGFAHETDVRSRSTVSSRTVESPATSEPFIVGLS
jgi:hypothetical protein